MPNTYDNEVGYKKPPRTAQFQKGKSGNPSGRPRRNPTVAGVFQKVTRQLVRTNGHSGPQRISKLEASITQLVNKAATGELKAIRVLMQSLSRHPELITSPESITLIVRPVSAQPTMSEEKS